MVFAGRLERRIDVDRAVFLDDPAVVTRVGAGQNRAGLAVQESDGEVARCAEVHRRGHGVAQRVLRVHRVVRESAGPWSGGAERTIRIESGASARCPEDRLQWQSRGIGVIDQHARPADLQPRGDIAGVGVTHGRGCAAEAARARRTLRDRGRQRRRSVHDERERAIAGSAGGRRVAERAVRIELDAGRAGSPRKGGSQRHTVRARGPAEQAAHGVRHVQRRAREARIALGRRAQGRTRPCLRAHARVHAASDLDVRLHATVALVIGRQTERAIEQCVVRSVVVSAGLRRRDRHVVRLAGGQEHRALRARQARQLVAVLGHQRHVEADHRGDVHAQSGVGQAQQYFAVGRGGRWRQNRQRRTRNIGPVKRYAIDEEVERAVVHRRRIARMHGRIAALAGLRTPHQRGVEPRSAHRRVDGEVLRRVDLAQQQRDILVERRAVSRSGGRVRRSCSVDIRDDEHPVEPHRVLDRRLRAGVNDVGARTQRCFRARARALHTPANAARCSRRDLRAERPHAVCLSGWREDHVVGTCAPRCSRPCGSLHRVRWARDARRGRTQAAAQLAVDHQRSGDAVGCAQGRERQVIHQIDRQRLTRGHRDQRWLPRAA